MEQSLKIKGKTTLNGTVKIQGSKNAALPILAATTLLEAGKSLTLLNVPHLEDTHTTVELLEAQGMICHWQDDKLVVTAGEVVRFTLPDHLVRKMRASSLLLGPLLARRGASILPLPGGCSIGSRPLDLHFKGLAKMGAEIELRHGAVHAKAEKLAGARIYLDFPSVGATENLMMAAAAAHGVTQIENAAQEPEIVNLAEALCVMGAEVKGAGTGLIEIHGKGGLLHGGEVSVIPDRIAACTYLLAGVMTNGQVCVADCDPSHFDSVLAKLEDAGVRFTREANRVTVLPSRESLTAVSVKTMPYPGFPTDVQPQLMAALTLAQGTSVMQESIFENRFMHVPELSRMGASIEIQGGNHAIITGVPSLNGAHVKATDLRAGAALTIAGLVAEGYTVIHGLHHILRGYENFVDILRSLGATIDVIQEADETL